MNSRLFVQSPRSKVAPQPGFKLPSPTKIVFWFYVLAFLTVLPLLFPSVIHADIAFVKNIGTASSTTTGTTLSVTVPAAGVAAGTSVVVSIAINPSSGTVSCSDSGGNSYAVDRNVTNGSGTTGVRTIILSAHNILALTSGNAITCTHPSVSARAMSANQFSGIASSAPRDQTMAGTGTSAAPSSGSTPTTTQAYELLLGAIGVEGPTTDTFTAGSSYTTIGRRGTSGGAATNNITVNPEYRLVTATGAYSATGTLGTSRRWAAAIGTYKAAVTATKLAITSVNGASNPSAGVGFPVVVQSQDANGVPRNLTAATGVSLSLQTGTGTLGGTLTGTIAAGTNQVTINGVTYTKAESGVVLRATRTSGDVLTIGDSIPFTVNPGAASTLAFTTQPGSATAGSPIPGPPTVTVRDSSGNTVTSSTASITVAIGTNPSGGVLSGTTNQNASSGVASFSNLSINLAGIGYTLTASSAGLTSATSAAFNITAPSGPGTIAGTVSRASDSDPISGALVEALQASVVKGSATTGGNGSYSIPSLTAGTYDVRASAGGYTTQTQNGVTVSGGATTTVNVSLNAAAITEGISYFYDELGRVKGLVNPLGEAGTYSYDAVGNLLSISRYDSSQVSIVEFTPNSSPVGTVVTLFGTGFSTTASQNTVTFNGVAATVASATLTQITTTVPSGATSGPIGVTSPAGSATSAAVFTVTSSTGAPTITGFTPTIGAVGTPVTITGTNFQTNSANNVVRFNITPSLVDSSTTTTIATTVPASGSGRISVTTQLGKATSTADFFISPSPYTAADVEFAGRIAFGESRTVTINTANKIALVVFDGAAGQRVSLLINGVTINSSWSDVNILKPDGTVLVSHVGFCCGVGGGGSFDVMTLPATGTYTISIDPASTGTGSMTLTLYNVPPDITSTITPGGPSVTVTTTTPGQNANVTFSGTAAQRISLLISGVTINSAWTDVYIKNPDGTILASKAGFCCGVGSGSFFDTLTLPATGTYTIFIDLTGASTGSMTLTLYNVPPDVTSTITPGGPSVTVSTTTPGQNANVTFSGTAGQRISLSISGVKVNASWTDVYIRNPDGTTLASKAGFCCGVDSGGAFFDPLTLPATGTYTIFIDLTGTSTGTMSLTLYDVPADVTGTITIGGPAVNVTITTPGQNGSRTFNGNASQQVTVRVTNNTMGSVNVALVRQDGTSTLTSTTSSSASFNLATQTLPATETYTVRINPSGANTGSMNMSVTSP
jgi:YD repeat-containing protein